MQVHIFDQALPAGALAAVCKDARALADSDNFWVAKERVLQGPDACSTPAELTVCLLYQHVKHLLPADWQGAEYWVQVYKPGTGLGFHFDKDEHLLTATGQMQHPIWSSILYLTGSTGSSSSSRGRCSGNNTADCIAEAGCQQQHQQQQQQQQAQQIQTDVQEQKVNQQQQQQDLSLLNDWDGVRQAPTVILEQFYDQELGCPVPSAPSKSMMVWPVKGTYCLFDGRLGHGVLDSCSGSIRATLLVNWWTGCPMAVEQLQDASIEQQQLTRLNSTAVHALIQTSQCGQLSSSTNSTNSNSISNANGESCYTNQDAVVQKMAAVRLDRDGSCCQHDAPATQQQQQQRRQVPCLKVTADAGGQDDDGDSGMHLVDDLLAHHKLTLIGPQAVSAVRFEHPGFVLCPIEDPSGGSNGSSDGSNGSNAAARLQTLGAFVSAELMGDSDSSSCSSEDESKEP